MPLKEIIPDSFTSLLSLFGIRLNNQKDNTFWLSGVVMPTVLVGSTAPIQAIESSMTLDSAFSAGELAAPAANTVLADTGPQVEGIYAVTVWFSGQYEGAGFSMDARLQRRDAANAASVWSQIFALGFGSGPYIVAQFTARLLVNERIRLITKQASGNNATQATIFLQRVA